MQRWDNLCNRVIRRESTGNIILVIVITFALKSLLSANFIFLSDEAYLALWGKTLSAGYYDHPPMTGWLNYFVMSIGPYPFILRIPVLLISIIIGLGVYLIIKDYEPEKAYPAFLLYMCSPFDFVIFTVMTDAPLMLFSFLSVFCMFKAERHGAYGYYAMAGIFMGLAFLSKYFSLMIFASFWLYYLLSEKSLKKTAGFVLMSVCSLPFIIQNLVWNYLNGWPNFMHNLFNRLDHDTNAIVSIASIVLTFFYLVTPVVCYFLYTNRARIVPLLWNSKVKLLAIAFALPVTVFMLCAFTKTVRPHWMFFILPLAFVLTGFLLQAEEMGKSIRFSFNLSIIQTAVACFVFVLPLENLKSFVDDSDFASLILHLETPKVVGEFSRYGQDNILASASYSFSALLEFYSSKRVVVFGGGSKHGRQDDIYTNFKSLDSRNFAILLKKPETAQKYSPFFRKSSIKEIQVHDTKLYILLGEGFDYASYRQNCLANTAAKFYTCPGWLPGTHNFFREKYEF